MRKTFLWIGLVVLLVGAYFVYRLGWGAPFSLNHLATRQAFFYLISHPESFTQIGLVDGTMLDFHSGELEEVSVAQRDRQFAMADKFLAELRRFDRDELSMQDRLTYDAQVTFITESARLKRFGWVSSDDTVPYVFFPQGLQMTLPQFLLHGHVIGNAKTARTWVERLERVGRKIDEGVAEMRRQAQLGATPPAELIDRTIESARVFMQPTPEEHPLATHLAARLASLKDEIDDEERAALQARALVAIRHQVYPAYSRLEKALSELRDTAAQNPAAGVIRLPQGIEYYQTMLQRATTTTMTAEEVHAIGLREVSRGTVELDRRLKDVGLGEGTVGERLAALARDPRFLAENSDAAREKILREYSRILADVDARVGEFFATRPAQKLEVKRYPRESEGTQTAASYQPAAQDGSRPGIFFVNLRDPASLPGWGMKTTAYHEGVPGHYFQISIAQSQADLPLVRQQPVFPAYAEGWAFYAEQLAAEMGMYRDDPYGDIGRLQWVLVRGVRLVVDTGMHAMGWTHRQAIDYMVQTTGTGEAEATSEIERYMSLPGRRVRTPSVRWKSASCASARRSASASDSTSAPSTTWCSRREMFR